MTLLLVCATLDRVTFQKIFLPDLQVGDLFQLASTERFYFVLKVEPIEPNFKSEEKILHDLTFELLDLKFQEINHVSTYLAGKLDTNVLNVLGFWRP